MITYRGKNYEFSKMNDAVVIPDEKLATLPKAVLLLLMVGAARGSFTIADTVLAHLSSKVGKYITDGQLNTDGQRVFRKDRELQTALHMLVPAKESPTQDSHEPEDSESSSKDTPSPASGTDPDVSRKPELAALLTMIRQFLLRFVVFADPAQAVAVSLWVAHTWVIDAFHFTPYLHIYSPTKRSGKSRLLECLHMLVFRPWSVVSATEATIMRKIDAESPTMLYDEIDGVYRSSRDKSKESLRAVLNCGFVRGAKVPRCAGREIIEYSVFGPKAFAGIGDSLPDTVKDRSIRIQLVRRTKDQVIETLRSRDVEDPTCHIVEGLTSWAGDEAVIQELQASRPLVPHELGDRAADIAEPLLAIADLAGGEWAEAARTSLVAILRMNDDEEADEPGVRLLAAIRDIFVAEGKKQLPTIRILRKLATREEEEAWTLQWPRDLAGSNARGPAAKMATLLRPYGISAGTIRLPDDTTPKGYRLEALSDAFSRYLPALPEKDATTPHANLDQGTVEPPTKPANTEEMTLDNT